MIVWFSCVHENERTRVGLCFLCSSGDSYLLVISGIDADNAPINKDPEGNGQKVFDIHSYHREEGHVRATYLSSYRMSDARGEA